LDPAKPLLQAKNKKDRMDAGDAIQVQVIHTNAGFFGMSGLQGDVDFCMNGGRIQPYCKNTPGEKKFNLLVSMLVGLLIGRKFYYLSLSA